MNTETDSHTSVKAAISEVLSAERDALAEVATCESRADQVLRDARQAVRAMVRRTQHRVSRLHAGCAEKTHELMARMERDAATYGACAVPAESERQMLFNAVRAVARDLTAREPSDAD